MTERGAGRIWQGDRRNGANTLTIAGGHAIDALCFVLGEFEEVSARLAVNLKEWHNPETDEVFKVDSPDWISVSGRLVSGAQVAFLTTTVSFNPGGTRFEIFGREGTLVLTAGSLNQGATRIVGSRGKEPLEPLDPPRRFRLVPDDTPSGSPSQRRPGVRALRRQRQPEPGLPAGLRPRGEAPRADRGHRTLGRRGSRGARRVNHERRQRLTQLAVNRGWGRALGQPGPHASPSVTGTSHALSPLAGSGTRMFR